MNVLSERILKFQKQIQENPKITLIMRGILMGVMLIAIFLYLLNTELTSAPEFIYNQF